MAALKDVYWMSSPLAIDQRNVLNKEIDALQGRRARFANPMKKYIDPKNEVHIFRKIEHWTLEVDGKCYELGPDLKKKLPFIKKLYDMIKPTSKDATEWHDLRKKQQIKPERRKIGRTRKTHEEIEQEVNYIWTNFNSEKYLFFTQNCQNFAYMLYERIGVEVVDAERHLWERMPDPIGYRIAEGAQLTLAGQAIKAPVALGSGAAFGGTGTATAGTGTVGAMSGTGGTAAAGGTTAGGTTAVGSTGTVGAMTGGTATGGTAAVGGTGTTAVGASGTMGAMSGGTAAGGSTAVGGTGATAAGGTAAGGTTAGGTTAGSGAAGHMGFGAKAAGLLHGSGHGATLGTKAAAMAPKAAAMAPKAAALMHGGHAVAIGGGAAKVGIVAAGGYAAAPVIVTGGLVYLAWRGKKSKRFNKKNKKEEDMDVLDMLGMEDQYNEACENPELAAELEKDIEEGIREELKDGIEDPDQEIDEGMAEKLEFGRVMTEPGVILKETEIMPEVQDERRTQTVA
ncbi:MAG: hypothetical protein Q9216_004852 [Gyalolechia sp. 2 TL-2023]